MKRIFTLIMAVAGMTAVNAQNVVTETVSADSRIQNFQHADKNGINLFETPKGNEEFDGFKVKVGGSFALQFQALETTVQVNDAPVNLAPNFNLPTANLDIDVQFVKGVRLHMRNYLSSRHHNETWVKGGYLQIDDLGFIGDFDFLNKLMAVSTFKFGMNDINYGDAHFRRSDNANAFLNPFVGNYIMDSFTTEAFGEYTFQKNGIIAVAGLSNGNLNQSTLEKENQGVTVYGKLGYDKQINEDLRVRFTGSVINSNSTGNGGYIYSGDRAGSRYYNVGGAPAHWRTGAPSDDFRSGRVNPSFNKYTNVQFNPFVKYRGLEFFGIYEIANGRNEDLDAGTKDGSYTQLAGELLYRFGSKEQFYFGGRYNSVAGAKYDGDENMDTSRFNVGGGWFMTNNIMVKAEYMAQKYSENFSGQYGDAQFDGFVVEAVIAF